MRTITTKKLNEKRKVTMKPIEFDFKNKDYNIDEVIGKCQTNPRYALWVTNNMPAYEIAKIFARKWDRAMEEKRREESKA